jgi:hypothetical protein
MTLAATEFLRRFVLHVLPRGFVRIRHFGFLANRHRATMLSCCRERLLAAPVPPATASKATSSYLCPHCRTGRMATIERLTAVQIRLEQVRPHAFDNTS